MTRFVFIISLIFLVQGSAYSNSREMDLQYYLKTKLLGKSISCSYQYKKKPLISSEKCTNILKKDDDYYASLKNGFLCKIHFFSYGINRINQAQTSSKKDSYHLEFERFLNSSLKNFAEFSGAAMSQSSSVAENSAQMQKNDKNNWTSDLEIHYTELSTMKNKKAKFTILPEGLFVGSSKIGMRFEREISKEKK
ncbi:hypothetical protein DID76_03215 [Candidatus Marinamargulisbacteria bacterium SCGC AG-414-C22]|nr:hypothetical protein DID76_03215 [Candidatus Marinamargulisbacteria bacterium SCGC AG-414-C22]